MLRKQGKLTLSQTTNISYTGALKDRSRAVDDDGILK
jgi:hypothetical protein